MIAVIGAMEIEIQFIKNKMKNITMEMHGTKEFYVGEIEDCMVVVCLAGVGKVNAAHTTTLLLEQYEVDYIINIGVAGGISPSEPGDLVISNNVAYNDVDITAFSSKYVFGQMSGEELLFPADTELKKAALEATLKLNIKSVVGNIVSGDKFVTSFEMIKDINQTVNNIVAVEMEAGAIAHIARIYHKPFIVLRAISDVIGATNQELDFDVFLEKAAKNSTDLVIETIKYLM